MSSPEKICIQAKGRSRYRGGQLAAVNSGMKKLSGAEKSPQLALGALEKSDGDFGLRSTDVPGTARL
jgi:hypothetical protein